MYEENFATCDECGHVFTPKFAGATTCFSCWKDTPPGRRWRARKDAESRAGTRQEPPRSDFKQETRVEYRNCSGFDLAMCRQLLQLCHPDKHEGSAGSVKATQWLNDRLRELKGS